MSDTDRITTMDIIIKVIDEHEGVFASLVNHLDSSIDRMDIQRIEGKLETKQEKNIKILSLEKTIKELESQIRRYERKIKEFEKNLEKLRNNTQ